MAVVPGLDFGPGGEGYVRVSLAAAPEALREGLARLGQCHARFRRRGRGAGRDCESLGGDMSEENSEESWRGKVGKLSQQDIDRFLEEPNLARVACLDATGWPYAIPCWYQWDGKSIWLVARAKSKWAHFLVAEARCAVTIDESSAADDQQAKGAGVQRNFRRAMQTR